MKAVVLVDNALLVVRVRHGDDQYVATVLGLEEVSSTCYVTAGSGTAGRDEVAIVIVAVVHAVIVSRRPWGRRIVWVVGVGRWSGRIHTSVR